MRHLNDLELRPLTAEALGNGWAPGTPASAAIEPDQNPKQIVAAGIVHDDLDRVIARERGGLGPELLGQSQALEDALTPSARQTLQGGSLDIERMPGDIVTRGETCGAANDTFAALAGTDAGEDGLTGLPHGRDRLIPPVLQHLPVDAVGGAPQGQLAQCDQIALAKKVLDRPLGLVPQIDLSLFQTLQQLVRRQIDQHHLIGGVEDVIGQRLPDPDAGDAADDVVERLQVLDVERGVGIDAGGQQFLDVLPALGVTRPGRIGVGEFIDQDEARATGQRAVEIEFAQDPAAMIDRPPWQALQSVQQGFGLLASMGLCQTDDHIDPLLTLLVGGHQHRIGLADAR